LKHTAARVWTEVLVLYFGSCLLIRSIKGLVDGGTLSNDWLVLVALVFLYVPMAAEKWNGFAVSGHILFPSPLVPALKKAALFAGGIILLIYVFFLPGYHVCQTWLYHWFSADVLGMARPYGEFSPINAVSGGIALTILMQALYQLLCVGYAEEFFYRGYMQTRLDGLFDPRRFALFGAHFGWSLPITALLFTLGHSLVTLQWWQPFIFFPALVFGWMRARTGNILAAALFHAFANTLMIILDHIYGLPGSRLEPTSGRDLLADLASPFRWLMDLF
jgi:membrane protease YdiL (CAAX protease family)